MTEQKIIIPDNMELVKVNDFEYKIVEKKVKLPQSWEEFCENYTIKFEEQYIEQDSSIKYIDRFGDYKRGIDEDKNLLPNKEYAEAILALCQLIQLRDCYRQGWKPDWTSDDTKYCINFNNNFIQTNGYTNTHQILAFQTYELRQEFVNNFKDLIEKVEPLFM